MMAPELPEFVCPRCHGTLDGDPRRYECADCGSIYPIVLGIPDFRVFPDPWIGFEEDRLKAIQLDSIVRDMSFADAVRAYWSITPSTPQRLAERYIQHVLDSRLRAENWLEELASIEAPSGKGAWLDIGCGTAALVEAAAARHISVVGVDIALRWLVVGRRRDGLARSLGQLVCANGEYLPYAPDSFTRVVSLGTLEHARDANQIASESRRVLRPGGVMRLTTVNRFTLFREPHVQVWGVGFVPRKWADRYVRLRSDQHYLHHKPLSPREVARALKSAGFSNVRVEAATILPADRRRVSGIMQRVVPIYDRLKKIPLLGILVRWASPLLDARGVAD